MTIKIQKIKDVITCGDGCCQGDVIEITINGEDHHFVIDNDLEIEIKKLIEFIHSQPRP